MYETTRLLQTPTPSKIHGLKLMHRVSHKAIWDPTTPFDESLGPLGKGSGIRTLALRTCKADVVVGLPPGRDEELRSMKGGGSVSGAREWAWNGKWAVVQMCDGKA